MKKTTHKIIELLKQGKTQTEVRNMGYPFATVRYHYMKLYRPEQHEKFLRKFNRYRRKQRKDLSTDK